MSIHYIIDWRIIKNVEECYKRYLYTAKYLSREKEI